MTVTEFLVPISTKGEVSERDIVNVGTMVETVATTTMYISKAIYLPASSSMHKLATPVASDLYKVRNNDDNAVGVRGFSDKAELRGSGMTTGKWL